MVLSSQLVWYPADPDIPTIELSINDCAYEYFLSEEACQRAIDRDGLWRDIYVPRAFVVRSANAADIKGFADLKEQGHTTK